MQRDLPLDDATEATVRAMLLDGDAAVPGWQSHFVENVPSTKYSGQGCVLNLRMPRESRRELLEWAHRYGWGITDLLQAAVSALLDRENVSPDEVHLPWRT